jgi:hypothetical protein
MLILIQEDTSGETPSFGICFVDTSTGSFFLTEFEDDVDLTKFETFVAQIRPKELVLEKVRIAEEFGSNEHTLNDPGLHFKPGNPNPEKQHFLDNHLEQGEGRRRVLGRRTHEAGAYGTSIFRADRRAKELARSLEGSRIERSRHVSLWCIAELSSFCW